MLEFRRYTEDDKEKCVRLLQTGHDPKFSVARFDWLHHKNPMSPSDIALAVDGSEIVGFYASLKKKAIIDGKEHVLARDIDPVVSPDYRGKGLFTKLLEFALEEFTDVDFFYNFANRASTRGFEKMGWRQIGPLRDYVCQLGYERTLSRDYLLYMATFGRSKKLSESNVRKIAFEELRASTSREPVPPGRKIWVERSMPFLLWRYSLNPLHEYNLFAEFEGRKAVRLCVTRFLPEKGQLLVLDVVPLEIEDYSLEAFLPIWADMFKNAAVYLWNPMPKSSLRYFVTNPMKKSVGQKFLVRKFPGKPVPDSIYDIGSWYLSRGDSEVF